MSRFKLHWQLDRNPVNKCNGNLMVISYQVVKGGLPIRLIFLKGSLKGKKMSTKLICMKFGLQVLMMYTYLQWRCHTKKGKPIKGKWELISLSIIADSILIQKTHEFISVHVLFL